MQHAPLHRHLRLQVPTTPDNYAMLPDINHTETGAPRSPGAGPGGPVLLITARYPPAICGVGDHTVGLRHYLQQQGYTVWVATGSPEAAGTAGVQVYPTDAADRTRWLLQLIALHGMQRVCWQYSPYALHPAGMPRWVVQAAKALQAAGVPQYACFHEVRIRYAVPGWYNTWRAWQQQRIATALVRCCRRVATSIPLYLPYLQAAGGVPPVHLIPVPPNIPIAAGVPEPAAAPAAPAPVVVLFANRALPGVLEALAALQRLQPGLQVVLLGYASEQERAAQQQAMVQYGLHARSTGALPLPLLAAELSRATLLLLPQPLGARRAGGISLKNGTLAAALAAGRPVIATRGDMTAPPLQHATHLHLLHDNTAPTWQQAIHLLLHDAAYRHRLAQAGHAFYQRYLSWEVVGRQFETLLELPAG